MNNTNFGGKGRPVNIYGKNGFLEFCEQFMQNLDKKSQYENLKEEDLFYVEWYKSPIFQSLCVYGDNEYNLFPDEKDEGKKAGIEKEKIIEFKLNDKDGNEQAYQESHQYLYFLSVLYQEYKKNNFKKTFDDSTFISEVIKYQMEASKRDQYDYSFINFDNFLNSLSYEELNNQTLENALKEYAPFKEIYYDVLKQKTKEKKEKEEKNMKRGSMNN